jgi:hypothetical protein
MTKETQAPWPRTREDGTERRSPTAFFANPDTIAKSDLSVAGPLRMGTAPGAGPTGALRGGNNSDFGMDRVTPRRIDIIGTPLDRQGAAEPSPLVSRELRGSNRRKEE